MFDGLINSVRLIFGNLFWALETIKAALWFLIYGIASLLLMLLDFVQDCFKKLAGLDTYYYEGVDSAFKHEDILQRLLTTPEILKAFGSLVVVGIILLFLLTIIQFIRVEYTTEGSKNSKGNIIQQALKSIAMFVIVPIASFIGIFLSNKLLQIIDNATDPSPGSTIAGNIFKISVYDANPIRAGKSNYGGFGMAQQEAIFMAEKGYEAYKGPSWVATIDGISVTFKSKDYDGEKPDPDIVYGFANATKVQITQVSGTEVSPTGKVTSIYEFFAADDNIKFSGVGVNADTGDTYEYELTFGAVDPEELCERFKDKRGEDLAETLDDVMSHRGQNEAQNSTNRYSVTGHSSVNGKFVGLGIDEGDDLDYTNPFAVMYFYNMQDINYFMLFVCSGFAIVCLYKAAFGMVMRLYMCAILFIISPPIIALAPMDNGKALSSWKSKFIGQVLAGYGTVVALNLFFTVLPIIEKIELFRAETSPWQSVAASFFNGLVQMVFVLVGCFMLKDISKTISGFIGAEDAMASGDGMSKQIGAVATKAASVGVGLAAGGAGLAMRAGSHLAGKLGSSKKVDKAHEGLKDARDKAETNEIAKMAGITNFDENDESQKMQLEAFKKTMTEDEKASVAKAVNADQSVIDATDAVVQAEKDSNYNSKFKSDMRKFATSSNLAGNRISAAGGGILKSFVASSGVAKKSKEILGDSAPVILGGKGYHAHDGEIAGKNDYYEKLIGDEVSSKKKDKGKKSVERMGTIASIINHEADRATMEKASMEMINSIQAGSKKAAQEVEAMRQQMVQIMNDIKAGLIDKNKGTEQMVGMYQQVRSEGLLTDNSEKTIGNMLSMYNQGRITDDAMLGGFNIGSTFESKFEVAVKDPDLQNQIAQLKSEIQQGNIQAAGKISKDISAKLKSQNVKFDSLEEIMNKIAAEASKSKAEEKDLKKLLAQLGKMSK